MSEAAGELPPYAAIALPPIDPYANDPKNPSPNFVVPVPVSSIPDACILLREQNPPPKTVFDLPVERHYEGVVCHHPALDYDSEMLWNYFLAYLNERPGLMMTVEGTHNETKKLENGETRQVSVRDFHVSFVLDQYVADWTRLFAMDQGGLFKPFKDILQLYSELQSKLKEIQLNRNIVGWDYAQLEANVKNLVKLNYHYQPDHQIHVRFVKKNHTITAYSSSLLMQLMKSCCFWFLMAITCLWCIVWPLYSMNKTKISNQIIVEYPITLPEGDFYMRVAPHIVNAVRAKQSMEPMKI